MPVKRIAKIKSEHKSLLAITVLLVGVVLLLPPNKSSACSESFRKDAVIRLDNNSFEAEIAADSLSRTKGLSGRKCLPKNRVLLFVFDEQSKHGIWMKDMLFDIDVIWLDSDKKVVDIVREMSPSSYPKVYYPKNNAKYVIETEPGLFNTDIAEGKILSW